MLATGGFWGKLKYTDIVINPFLGSSIPGLPEEITGLVSNPSSCEIFTLNQESNLVNPVRSYRTINQYLKTHSTNLWAFHANSYYDKGFFPTNPLFIKSKNPYVEAGSLLLKLYAEKKKWTLKKQIKF